MSQGMRVFWSAITAYLLIHVIYRLCGFNPIRDLRNLVGWVGDLSVWFVVYLSIYWILGKRFQKPRPDDLVQ